MFTCFFKLGIVRYGETDAGMLASEPECATAGASSEEDSIKISEWRSFNKFGRYGSVRISEWTFNFLKFVIT